MSLVSALKGRFKKVILMRSIKTLIVLSALALAIRGPAELTTAAWAESGKAKTEQAGAARAAAAARAKSLLERPDAVDLIVRESGREADYYSLGLQIARLTALLQALARPAAPAEPLGLSAPGAAGGPPDSIYGPEGPDAKSVRVILEYRLLVGGNPRLAVGKVQETDSHVRAQVVTKDGSLVEEYEVDKHTGIWKPLR